MRSFLIIRSDEIRCPDLTFKLVPVGVGTGTQANQIDFSTSSLQIVQTEDTFHTFHTTFNPAGTCRQ